MPTPLRAIRVPDELWQRAKAVAEREGETLSNVVRWALENFIEARENAPADND